MVLGPTPRNSPIIPSVLYMSLRPVMTDEVSNLTASGFGIDVFGEDVEMSRLDDARIVGVRAVLALATFSTREVVARCGCTL